MRPRHVRSVIALPTQTFSRTRIQHAGYSSVSQKDPAPATVSLSPRWLFELKSRVGKCIMFGLQPEQTREAGSIVQEIAADWRELIAGSEGFLTGKDRRGLYRQEVVWGEMVCFTNSRHVNHGSTTANPCFPVGYRTVW